VNRSVHSKRKRRSPCRRGILATCCLAGGQVWAQETLERSGYASTVDLIKNLPAMMGSSVESATVGSETYGLVDVSIHGIGESRTEGSATAGVSLPRGGARETNVSVSKSIGDDDSDGYNVILSASADRYYDARGCTAYANMKDRF
jgi:hypothetical protein